MFSNFKAQQAAKGVFSDVISGNANSSIPGNLILFLAIAQINKVELLPISWLPGLELLGEGASGKISQSIISVDESFAFKRFERTRDPTERYTSLISELLILSQPSIAEHQNVIDLKGISWDVEQNLYQYWSSKNYLGIWNNLRIVIEVKPCRSERSSKSSMALEEQSLLCMNPVSILYVY